jgi:hypothetical protein
MREPEEIWLMIGDFYSVHRWCPGVISCARDSATSNSRIVTVEGGSSFREELLEETAQSYRYRIHFASGPMSNYRATLAVQPGALGRGSLITWSSTFDCDEALQTELEFNMARTYQHALTEVAE